MISGTTAKVLGLRPAAASPVATAVIVTSCRNRFDPNGMTSSPSATSAVALVSRGPSAPT